MKSWAYQPSPLVESSVDVPTEACTCYPLTVVIVTIVILEGCTVSSSSEGSLVARMNSLVCHMLNQLVTRRLITFNVSIRYLFFKGLQSIDSVTCFPLSI